jgi:hypothetical protein
MILPIRIVPDLRLGHLPDIHDALVSLKCLSAIFFAEIQTSDSRVEADYRRHSLGVGLNSSVIPERPSFCEADPEIAMR